jgi:S1-C subfamily serine protease
MQSVSDLLNGQDAESGIRLSMQEPKRPGENVTPKTVPPSTGPPSSETPRQQQQPSAPILVSSGSGFFVGTEGHLVTNAHVVAGCTYVLSSRGGQISRVAIDEASDLALYIASEKVPFAALLRGGRGPRVGEPVIAIGFPLKGLLSSDAIITTGAISALAGLKNDRRKIQITAPVQPGNSGGPLLGENGSVVGVVVGKLDALKMAEVIGDIPQNVNFAVSLGTLQSFLNANGVPYLLDDGIATKTSADIAADASRYTVLLECMK